MSFFVLLTLVSFSLHRILFFRAWPKHSLKPGAGRIVMMLLAFVIISSGACAANYYNYKEPLSPCRVASGGYSNYFESYGGNYKADTGYDNSLVRYSRPQANSVEKQMQVLYYDYKRPERIAESLAQAKTKKEDSKLVKVVVLKKDSFESYLDERYGDSDSNVVWSMLLNPYEQAYTSYKALEYYLS